MNRLRHAAKRFQREDGTALIELAVILPILLILVVGVVNFAFLLQQYLRVADSARSGAEAAISFGKETNTTLMSTTAIAAAGNIPSYHATAVNVCTCAPGSAVVACSSTCPSYGQPAMYAQVTATATLPLILGTGAILPVQSIARVRVSCPSC